MTLGSKALKTWWKKAENAGFHLFSFLAHVSTKCSSWAIVIALCPASSNWHPSTISWNISSLNHWANLDETWQECSLGEALQKLFKEFNSTHNSGCHGDKKEKKNKIFENLLKLEGVELWYLLCSIHLLVDLCKVYSNVALGSKLVPPRESQEHRNKKWKHSKCFFSETERPRSLIFGM